MSERTRAFAPGVLFLALQAGLVLASQFGTSRHFCWAPHTTQVRYVLRVEEGGRTLSEEEIQGRYGLPSAGWEAHSATNLMDLVEARGGDVRVTLEYRVNGRDPVLWHWP